MSIAKLVKHYVFEHASIRASLQQGLLNYSSLARTIIKDCSLHHTDFAAIIVALRRMQATAGKDVFAKKIAPILHDSRLEIRNKVVVFIVEKEYLGKKITELHKEVKDAKGHLQIVEGIDVMTIITTTDFERLVVHYFHKELISTQEDLIEIILRSPKQLEHTPGVTAYLCSLLAEQNVNIVEMMSCWTDTIFVIAEKDLEKTVAALSL